MNTYEQTIEERQAKDKESVLEYLRKMPIVQIACDRAGIARATYYRWRNDDKEFKKSVDKAIHDGELFINDLSESQVITLIKDKNWSAISFWLKNHHPKYADKLKVEANISRTDEKLTEEEQKLVQHALACLRGNKNDQGHD